MAQYIDGFMFPISRNRVNEYKRVAEAVAQIYREHGAQEYLEFVGDEMNREGTRSFLEAANAAEDETIVFGWIMYNSRRTRDLVNERVEADPRMIDLIAPLVDPSNTVFDARRMAFGGFQPLVRSTAEKAR